MAQRLRGVVEAQNRVSIQPEIMGVATAVLVQNGDEAEAGQPLVRIHDTDFRERLKQARADHRIALAQLQRAEAQAREARSALERTRSLNERELGSRAELETAEARAASGPLGACRATPTPAARGPDARGHRAHRVGVTEGTMHR